MGSAHNGSLVPETAEADQKPEGNSLPVLVAGALGVVYGDIGTSPIYAFREALRVAASDGSVLREDILGVLSLLKYIAVF